jgi:plasmid stability protein
LSARLVDNVARVTPAVAQLGVINWPAVIDSRPMGREIGRTSFGARQVSDDSARTTDMGNVTAGLRLLACRRARNMLANMGRMLQIKDVPDDVHRVLKARAALEGLTLTEYARQMLALAARRPSRAELIAELSAVEPLDTGESAAEALARVRDDAA